MLWNFKRGVLTALLIFTVAGCGGGGGSGSDAPGDTTAPTVSSTSPANGSAGVAMNSSIAATFSEGMDLSTINGTTVTLSGGTGSVSGTVTCNGSTATFTPSSNLSYSTTYTATITTGAKDAAGNAVASNYTWNFTTGNASDTTPPTVSSTNPANNDTGVAVNSSITATFSETMDTSTITTATFYIGGVSGSVTYNGTTATFTPSSNLNYNTAYTVTVTNGVKDAAGNAMASNYTWSFTTGVAPDTTPPTVSSTSPAGNATGIAINTAITATFSETMDSSTVTTATFTLKQGTTAIAGTVTYNGTTATFTPSSSLSYSTTYTATTTMGVKDSAGNAMAGNYTWQFTTGSALYQMGGSIQGSPLNLTNTVTTIAGSAFAVPGSTDGTGTAARFHYIDGITTDGTNLFVADYGNSLIRKVVISTGVVTTIAGSAGVFGSTDGTGTSASFSSPFGITTDGTNLFVADSGNSTIRKIVISTGAVTTIAGSAGVAGATDGTGTAARFSGLWAITTDGINLFVTDAGNYTIRKVVISTGAVTTIAGSAGVTGSTDGTGSSARFSNQIYGITTDGTNLFVTDAGNMIIRKIVISTGVVTTIAGSTGLTGSTDGTGTAARFSSPHGISTDGTNMFVTEASTIRKIVISTGAVTTIAGSAGVTGSTDGTGTAASFFYPSGITTDGTNLFVGEHSSDIRKIQ